MAVKRRDFLSGMGAGIVGATMPGILNTVAKAAMASDAPHGGKRPNIVWLCLEDCSANLGCYGDRQAITPNIDKLASEGAVFTRAFTHGPICAPSRGGIASGMYATTIGAHHLRSVLLSPPEIFTQYLREAGYYVTWGGGPDFCATNPGNGKQDFNYIPRPKSFDAIVDYLAKAPREPFFAFGNIFNTHEGQISSDEDTQDNTAMLTPQQRHDPAKMVVPPYLPDVPQVRRHIANYYDAMTANDYRVGQVLAALDRQGLADNTIVFVFSDHGWGLPRGKRWLYDTGIREPLIVRWPGRIQPGTVRDELVAWIDLAPTALHAAGVAIPRQMQGHALLDPQTKRRPYVFAARDRADETFERIRAVRDERFKYIRNFYPELPYDQRIKYAEHRPSMVALRELHAEGKLNATQEQAFFAAVKPPEELYDVQADPWEIHNLADDAQYAARLKQMSAALDQWMVETKDMGEIPEEELRRRGILKDPHADKMFE